MDEPRAWSKVFVLASRFFLRDFFLWDGIGLLVENDGIARVRYALLPLEGGILSTIGIDGEVVDIDTGIGGIAVAAAMVVCRPGRKFRGSDSSRWNGFCEACLQQLRTQVADGFVPLTVLNGVFISLADETFGEITAMSVLARPFDDGHGIVDEEREDECAARLAETVVEGETWPAVDVPCGFAEENGAEIVWIEVD